MNQHDPRHVDFLVEGLGLENGNTVQTPIVDSMRDENPVWLDPEQLSNYKSHVARCMFLSQDRTDIQFAVNELCQRMSDPPPQSFTKLKIGTCRERGNELRASTRWNAQHWLKIARKQTSKRSKPLSTRSCTEPLRMISQMQGQRRFKAWDMVVKRYDQRNTSDRSSAYAALISNISERDRAKDVEKLDDILRNFINEANKYEGRFGKT